MPIPTPDFTFHVSGPSADHIRGLIAEVGAMLTGRRTFEVADGWGGQQPWDVPAFIVAHHVPDGWPRPGSTIQFVTDGIEAALERAFDAADGADVRLGGGVATVQAYLRARLIDELHLAIAPILLGSGERLFDNLGGGPTGYECVELVGTTSALHVRLARTDPGDG